MCLIFNDQVFSCPRRPVFAEIIISNEIILMKYSNPAPERLSLSDGQYLTTGKRYLLITAKPIYHKTDISKVDSGVTRHITLEFQALSYRPVEMALPPQHITVKRRRDDEPVDTLCKCLMLQSYIANAHSKLVIRHTAEKATA